MSWPQPTISGYNATPPADDGSQTASNVVAWATILAKIGNPLKTLLESTIGSIASYLTPTGAVMAFAGSSTPTGWLLCYGQAVSRSTFADLFAVIGTTYGVGDGATTFNVPDLRGRAVFGKDDMGGSAANRVTAANSGITGTQLGASGGDERLHGHSHSVSVSINDPGHNHMQNSHSHGISDPGHLHNFRTSNTATGASTVTAAAAATGSIDNQPQTTSATTGISIIGATPTNIAATTGISGAMSINASGAGTSANIPPAIVANWIIKT